MDQLLKQGAFGAPVIAEILGGALAVAWIIVSGRLNLFKGRNGKPHEQVGEIAGANIDKATADVIVAAIEKQTAETVKLSSALRADIRATEMLSSRLQTNTDAAKAVGGAIQDVRGDIQELRIELIRGKQ